LVGDRIQTNLRWLSTPKTKKIVVKRQNSKGNKDTENMFLPDSERNKTIDQERPEQKAVTSDLNTDTSGRGCDEEHQGTSGA
jgi:hypothetical protein